MSQWVIGAAFPPSWQAHCVWVFGRSIPSGAIALSSTLCAGMGWRIEVQRTGS